MNRYEHTQVGWVIILAMAAAIVLIGLIMANAGLNWIAVGVMIIVGAALFLFATLTVTIGLEELEVRFGPGLIRERFKLREIASCRVVKNPFYYGWGIHRTPHGWLYNVSGFSAVEITLNNGKQARIGTDVPQELEQAIRRAVATAK